MQPFFLSLAATGFVVTFAHAAFPTHWLPFVLTGRGQHWSKAKTLMVMGRIPTTIAGMITPQRRSVSILVTVFLSWRYLKTAFRRGFACAHWAFRKPATLGSAVT